MGMACLVVANIIGRLLGHSIAGTYESVQMVIVIVAAFAVGYTALKKGHVSVSALLLRCSPRTQAILRIFTTVISLGFWALLAWGSLTFAFNEGRGETTVLLMIPLFPLRLVWVFGLIVFSLVLLQDLYGEVKKWIQLL